MKQFYEVMILNGYKQDLVGYVTVTDCNWNSAKSGPFLFI